LNLPRLICLIDLETLPRRVGKNRHDPGEQSGWNCRGQFPYVNLFDFPAIKSLGLYRLCRENTILLKSEEPNLEKGDARQASPF
jgi:hypothetical protein